MDMLVGDRFFYSPVAITIQSVSAFVQNALASKLYIEKRTRGDYQNLLQLVTFFYGEILKKKLPDYIVKQIFLWLMLNEISEPLFATNFFFYSV